MVRRTNKTRSWETVIQHLTEINARYIVRRIKKSPYLYILDKQTKKQFVLKGIGAYDNMPEVEKIVDLIIEIGNKPWPEKPIDQLLKVLEDPDSTPQELNYQWEIYLVAGRAHNPKVVSSNPTPATNYYQGH